MKKLSILFVSATSLILLAGCSIFKDDSLNDTGFINTGENNIVSEVFTGEPTNQDQMNIPNTSNAINQDEIDTIKSDMTGDLEVNTDSSQQASKQEVEELFNFLEKAVSDNKKK